MSNCDATAKKGTIRSRLLIEPESIGVGGDYAGGREFSGSGWRLV